jgi:hypothetical protein
VEEQKSTTGARDPEQIVREIDCTREAIGSTVEELGHRLTPSRLAGDAKTYVKETAMREASTLWSRMSENAMPLALIGGGLVWMMRSQRSQRAQEWHASELPQGTGIYPEPVAAGIYAEPVEAVAYGSYATAGNGGESMKSRASERVSQMAGTVRQRTSEVSSAAVQATSRRAHQARQGFERMHDEQPLLMGLAMLTLGALVGSLVPPTRREDELLGHTRDDLVGAAAQAGREKAEQAREQIESRTPAQSGGAHEMHGAQPVPH